MSKGEAADAGSEEGLGGEGFEPAEDDEAPPRLLPDPDGEHGEGSRTASPDAAGQPQDLVRLLLAGDRAGVAAAMAAAAGEVDPLASSPLHPARDLHAPHPGPDGIA